MARIKEKLDGGLVTSKDPGELKPGEVSALQNLVYLSKGDGLTRVSGRTAFSNPTSAINATASGVTGLKSFQFPGSTTQYLAVQGRESSSGNNSFYYNAITGIGTPLTKMEEVSAGNYLELVTNRSHQYLLNGANANRVWYLNAGTLTSRAHGMQPISATPVSGSVVQTFSASATGLYEYWTTEVLRVPNDNGSESEIESTFRGKPITVNVTATTMSPVITRPGTVNSNATHWRLYRSPVKSLANDQKFPLGVRMGEAGMATLTITDGGAVSNTGQLLPTNTNATLLAYKDWTTPANAQSATDANALAVATSNSALANVKRQGYYGFAFSGVSGNIAGIEVEVSAKISNIAAGGLSIAIGRFDNATGQWISFRPDNVLSPSQIAEKSVAALTTSLATYTVGSSTDAWLPDGKQWADVDFTSTGWQVMLIAHFNTGFNAATLSVDYLKIKVYYGQIVASGNELIPFNAISLTIGGDTVTSGADGPPPTSSTGDIFQDALVVNDTSKPTYIRYSLAGKPESFPEQYYIDLGFNQAQSITCIKTIGRVLVAATDRSIYRINSLPTEDDANFAGGRVLDLIDGSHGIVNPMAACLFNSASGRTELAFVGYDGLYATDGFQIRCLSNDLDWNGSGTATSPDNFQRMILNNNNDNFELLLYYNNSGIVDDPCVWRLHFNYHPNHLKVVQGMGSSPKVSGPVAVQNVVGGGTANVRSATTFITNSIIDGIPQGHTRLLQGYVGGVGAYGGTITSDTSDPSIENSNYYATKLTTRRFHFPEQIGQAWTLNEIYVYMPAGVAGTVTVTPLVQKTALAEVTGTAKTLAAGSAGWFKVDPNIDCEGLKLLLQEDSGGASHGGYSNTFQNLVLDISGIGDLENSGA